MPHMHVPRCLARTICGSTPATAPTDDDGRGNALSCRRASWPSGNFANLWQPRLRPWRFRLQPREFTEVMRFWRRRALEEWSSPPAGGMCMHAPAHTHAHAYSVCMTAVALHLLLEFLTAWKRARVAAVQRHYFPSQALGVTFSPAHSCEI